MPNKVSLSNNYPLTLQSDVLYARAKEVMHPVTQTMAKGPGQYSTGMMPKYIVKGKGSHVWDADGNEFIDYQMAIGPISLGYAFEETDNAIKKQLEDGITFSMMHPLEVEVADLIHQVVPNAESVRYSKSGAEVTSAAIRVARAYTGKNKILCCGYHGWHDWYIAVTDRNRGIPKATQDLSFTFNFNDIQSVIDSIDEDVAAVILEPFVFEEVKNDFLHELRKVCDEHGIVLIFDEMWTGFRIALGGAQEYFGVKADLATFSKAVANGMPIGILTGKKEIMQLFEKDVFFFNTFGGEALSLASAKATIEYMRAHKVQGQLWKQGEKLKDGFNQIASELGITYTKCSGYPVRTMVSFDASAGNPLEMKTLVQQEMAKRGILWGGSHNMCYSHTDDDIAYTLSAYREVLSFLKDAVENKDIASRLRGSVLEPVFRKIGNFNMKPKQKV